MPPPKLVAPDAPPPSETALPPAPPVLTSPRFVVPPIPNPSGGALFEQLAMAASPRQQEIPLNRCTDRANDMEYLALNIATSQDILDSCARICNIGEIAKESAMC
jgi:hypothetical protein